jgi:hypothetical protein
LLGNGSTKAPSFHKPSGTMSGSVAVDVLPPEPFPSTSNHDDGGEVMVIEGDGQGKLASALVASCLFESKKEKLDHLRSVGQVRSALSYGRPDVLDLRP